MTELEFVTQQLDAIKKCAPGEIRVHFSQTLGPFRFIPAGDRRALADGFARWAAEHAAGAPLKSAYATMMQATDRFIMEEHEASLRLLMQARAGFEQYGDREGVGLCAMLTGAVYRTFGNYDLALKTSWEGYELLKESGRYPAFLAAVANTMANINLDLGHLEEARAMFNVTYEQSKLGNDFYFNIYALHGLGRVYMRMQRRAKAGDMFGQALALAEKSNHPLQISNSLTELATLAYEAQELGEAQSLSARALAIREQHRFLGGAVTNCIRLADIYCARSGWSDALAVLTRGLAFAEEVRVKPKMAQVHRMLSSVYERTHDLERSLFHFQRFHELHEQVQQEDSARKLADARLIFEAEQTKQENVVIRQQKAEIEQKNCELQDTIDELTRAKIGRKAKALTLAVAVVLFIFQDAILRNVLGWLPSAGYFELLGIKMVIIFSLSPINQGIERYLLRKMRQDRRQTAALAPRTAQV